MKKKIIMLAATAAAAAAAGPAAPDLQISVEPSRKSHLVRVNEPFEFIITASKPQKLKVVVSLDGEAVLLKTIVTPPASIPAVLPHPGFVRCAVSSFKAGSEPVLCGVGVEPDQLRPLVPEPADYDAFWEQTQKELNAIPADFKMTGIGEDETFRYYRISCANLNGQRAYGLLSLPRDPAVKMPLVVTFPGGEAFVSEDRIRGSMKDLMGFECARLIFQLPPYPPEKTIEKARARHQKFLKQIGLPRYVFYGIEDRTRFYARTGVAGCLRLLDETLKLPGLDPDRVVYCGSSHGGGFGIFLAAFSDKIKAAFCGVPNFGDRAGFLAGRHTPDSNSPQYRSHLDTLLYFDASFAARRITIPVMIGVGFTDLFCPPSAVYTIYNELRGPKFIFNKIKFGHAGSPPEYVPIIHLWLAKQIQGQ